MIRADDDAIVFAAFEGQVAELKMRPERGALPSSGEVTDMPAEGKLAQPVVLLGIAETRTSAAAALLWMYGRQIASFDTPTFSNKVGEIIAQATSRAQTSSRSR
jgi:hypothetical protein